MKLKIIIFLIIEYFYILTTIKKSKCFIIVEMTASIFKSRAGFEVKVKSFKILFIHLNTKTGFLL